MKEFINLNVINHFHLYKFTSLVAEEFLSFPNFVKKLQSKIRPHVSLAEELSIYNVLTTFCFLRFKNDWQALTFAGPPAGENNIN